MAIERNFGPSPLPSMVEEAAAEPEFTFELEEPDPDVEVPLTPVPADLSFTEFDANLAEVMDEAALHRLSSDLMEHVETDLASRADWEQTYTDGIKLLGIKPEEVTEPWPGACALTHPMLTEAVVRFQSETVMETLPAAGPVKTNVIGVETPDKLKAATRVKEDLNFQLMEVMTEFRPEHEKMLWHLPLAGSAFKKVYFDPTLQRQVSLFVPAEDVILPYGASALTAVTCPRITHRMKKSGEEIKKLQKVGFYRTLEADVTGPSGAADVVEAAKDEEAGQSPVNDSRVTLYEIHTEVDLNEYLGGNNLLTAEERREQEDVKPYVVTIDTATGNVLAIRRNWFEEDPLALARQHFVHYMYVPGFGAYGFGLIHLIGNYVRGATAFLRQLGDAGTLSNLPAGFKTKGMRIKNDNLPLTPGEFRDVDVLSGTLRENMLPLPFKEPSVVLAQLLGSIVEDGRRLAATGDLKISDISAQTPVGTTLAILERMLKVMSAVQARVHHALKQELRLLAGIIRDYTSDDYAYDVDAPQGRRARKTDYELVEILPVSDPNAATMSQKIVQYQAVVQLSASAPHIYNMQELHRQMLDVLGIKNVGKLVPTPEDMVPTDPVTENMAIITSKPVKAFLSQDHESHLTVHMSAMQDPLLQQQMGQNPKAQEMQAAMFAHICEHLAYAYRQQIEQMMGAPLPPPEQPLPPEVEAQLSRMLAQAAQKLLGRNTVQVQAQQAQQAAQDPVLQNERMDLELRKREVDRKVLKDLVETVLQAAKLENEERRAAADQVVKGMAAGTKDRQARENTQTQRMKIMKDAELRQRQLASTIRKAGEKK